MSSTASRGSRRLGRLLGEAEIGERVTRAVAELLQPLLTTEWVADGAPEMEALRAHGAPVVPR